MTEEWNPNDPDATRVLYDLSEWSFDQQAELASELAEAEVPHTWDGAELVVPEASETVADALINRVEARLGIVYGDEKAAADAAIADADEDDDDLPQPLDIADGAPTTEYDLDEWPEGDRQSITRALVGRRIAYRWEDNVLLVPTDHEAVVDALLDMIENGEFRTEDEVEQADDDDRLPFEALTTFFLAGERLQRNPLDADGLEQLLRAVDMADPKRPPYGVDIRLWHRTCELAEELADALAEDADPDLDATMVVAQDLHDLLRPFI